MSSTITPLYTGSSKGDEFPYIQGCSLDSQGSLSAKAVEHTQFCSDVATVI
jgi:hypothetical protein